MKIRSKDAAVPCRLILNELITNACKHAFPAGQPGEIRISFQERRGVKFYAQPEESGADKGRGVKFYAPTKDTDTSPGSDRSRPVTTNQDQGSAFELTVADNGIGLPAGVNWKKPETVGLQLVRMLSQQLNDSIELDRSSGTVFSLRFVKPSQND